MGEGYKGGVCVVDIRCTEGVTCEDVKGREWKCEGEGV